MEVDLVRGFVVEDDTNGVKWDDMVQCVHERLEHCLGIALCAYGLRGAEQSLITC